MMHDLANTLNGRYGFVVEYPDGTCMSEREVLWDEVKQPIAALFVYDFEKNLSLLVLRGYERFFFANEAISTKKNNAPQLSAKMIGGTNGEKAVECRLDLLGPKPTGSQRELPVAALTYSQSSFRTGA